MKVILAETAGFCFGVKRAVETVYEQIRNHPEDRKVYTYGPIIHNEEVVKDLEEKGVLAVEGEDMLHQIAGQILIIRSHGVPKRVYDLAAQQQITIVDATCPFVAKIHSIAEEESRAGQRIVIVGDPTHPEVRGIMGWVCGDAVVVQDEEEARKLKLDPDSEVTVVAQTTFNSKKFNNIVEIIEKKGYHIRVINTICNATRLRQKEAESVSKQADIMLVIGDRRSSNTQKLFDICKTYCKDTYYIQTVKELDEHMQGEHIRNHIPNLQSGIIVGITAGASTPNNIIQEVFLTCQKKKISNR